MAGEAVGVREEVTLERRGVGREVGDKVGAADRRFQKFVAPAQTGGLDGLGDVEDVVALGDGEGDGVDIAAQDAGVDLSGGRGVVEAVFAGEQLAALDGAEEIEGKAAADDPGVLELAGDGHGPGAGGDVDVGCAGSGGAGRRAEGSIDRISREGGRDQRQQQQGCEILQSRAFRHSIARGCARRRMSACILEQSQGSTPAIKDRRGPRELQQQAQASYRMRGRRLPGEGCGRVLLINELSAVSYPANG